MRALISYRHDGGESTLFAEWLYGALERPISPVVPKMDTHHLPPVSTFDRRLPKFVLMSEILLFVAAEYTSDSDACLSEFRFAVEYGKPIVVLALHADIASDPLVKDYDRIDFTADREVALRRLFDKIATLRTPEGTIAQLEERLRIRRNELRRLAPEARVWSRAEIDAIERRIKELLAEDQARWSFPGPSVARFVDQQRSGEPYGSGQLVPDLARRLRQTKPSVILVVGPEGGGKTRMIEQLTPAADIGRVVYHRAHGPRSFRAEDLTDILDADRLDDARSLTQALEPAAGREVVHRFRGLLAAFADERLTVIVDSAQNLVDRLSGQLTDPELDDVFEALATAGHPCAVNVVIVTRKSPITRNRTWLESAARVHVDGVMPVEEFREYLASLDKDDGYGLAHPAPELVSELHDRSGGRPRVAELVASILMASSIAEGDEGVLDTLERVVGAVRTVPEAELLDFLVGHLVKALTPEERRTARALAALHGPVPPAAITYMLLGATEQQVKRSLGRLRSLHLAHVTPKPDELVYVQSPDDDRILEPIRYVAEGDELLRDDLLRRAASYFALSKKDEIIRPDDLEADLAEIDILLRVGDVEAAFRAVEQIDDVLENWGCRWMLLHQRQQLCGRLHDEYSEAVNLQALGDIALLRDEFPAAEARYRQAISFVPGSEWLDVRKALFDSLGTVLMRTENTRRAHDLFDCSLAIAREFNDVEEEIIPLAGLSDCQRRWGKITKSVEYLDQAVEALRHSAGGAWDSGQKRRLAELLIKLSRRLGDMDDVPAAVQAVHQAGELARECGSWSVQCQQADTWADLLIRQGRFEEAQQTALDALGAALELGSVPLARQLRNTLAFCSLQLGDVDEARAHIEEAERHRAVGQSLVTLALAGIIEHRRNKRWRAQNIFRRLRAEAVERGSHDRDDFGALDMEGLARSGEHLGYRALPLDAAIFAFTRARRLTSAPGIIKQLTALLREFQDERLEPAISVVSGDI